MSIAPPQRMGRYARAPNRLLRGVACLLLPWGAQAQPIPPHLIVFDTDGSDSAGFGTPPEPAEAPVTAMRLRFDLPVAPVPLDFRLVHAGRNDVLETTNCAAVPDGDDRSVAVLATDVFEGSGVLLALDAPTGLASGRYRLLACDSLASLAGLPLDGDDDGLPGGIARRDFRVAHDPQLRNPGFATGDSRWKIANLGLAGKVDASWSPLDADASATSGAMRVAGSVGAIASVVSATCAIVPPPPSGTTVPASVRFRYRVLSGDVRFVVTIRTGFAGDVGESGCLGPSLSHTYVVDPTGPMPDFSTHDSGTIDLEALPVAEFAIRIIGLGGDYEVLLDDVGLNLESAAVFTSSFEGSPP